MRYIENEKEASALLEKIKPYKEKSLYLYCNLSRYGVHNPNFKVLVDERNGVVIGQYYGDSAHLLALKELTEDAVEYIRSNRFRTIFSSERLTFLDHYDEEITGVYKLTEMIPVEDGRRSLRNLHEGEMGQLTDFLYEYSPEYRKTYSKENLYAQLKDRLVSGYCRCFGLFQGNELIGCAFTKAEINDTMIVGGILVCPEYRGQGFGKMLCSHKAYIACAEKKEAFCYIDDQNKASIHLHSSCGYQKVATVYKYTVHK